MTKATLIGILASHDDPDVNSKLAMALDEFHRKLRENTKRFHFLVTEGTFRRVIEGGNGPAIQPLPNGSWIRDKITVLPEGKRGGITILSYFITQRKCSIIWPFFTPLTPHWLNPENLALIRLCDYWHAKKLMNLGSVREWIDWEAEADSNRHEQDCHPLQLTFRNGDNSTSDVKAERYGMGYHITLPSPPEERRQKSPETMTIALIAHDEMKARMVEFASDNEHVLSGFKRILTTGTTGRAIQDATTTLDKKIFRYHSGPKGGDIEIATEILFGKCDVVIFFIDPLHPHPHVHDIRTVFAACMLRDDVRMLTNEMQARQWMERVLQNPRRASGAFPS